MANIILKYDKQLNTLPFHRMSVANMNLFFTVLGHVQRQIKLPTQILDVEEIMNDAHCRKNRYLVKRDLDDLFKGLAKMKILLGEKQTPVKFTLFEHAEYLDSRELELTINPQFIGLIDGSSDNWVRFNLNEFVSLQSKYAKRLYLLVKQFRTTGIVRLSKDEFYHRLGISQSYVEHCNLSNRVFKPIMYTLAPLFTDFNIAKMYKTHHQLVAYRITFEPESDVENDSITARKFTVQGKVSKIKQNTHMTLDEKKKLAKLVMQANNEKQIGVYKMLDKSLKASDIKVKPTTKKTVKPKLRAVTKQQSPTPSKQKYADKYGGNHQHKKGKRQAKQAMIDWNKAVVTDDEKKEQLAEQKLIEEQRLTPKEAKKVRRKQLEKEFAKAKKELDDSLKSDIDYVEDLKEPIEVGEDEEFYL